MVTGSTQLRTHSLADSLFSRPRLRRTGTVTLAGLLLLAFLPVAAASVPTHGVAAPVPVSAALATQAPALHASGPSAPATPPNGHVVFNAPGPYPSAWGQAGIPPGSDALPTKAATTDGSWGGGGGSGSGAGSSSASNWDNRFCAGLWPSVSPLSHENAQSYYASGCYGHDEPGIQFYSTLPGSGGNVTWNVTLPVDRAPTLNQSDLYSAIWFGMTLTDPYAWMDQCFLELQFYPDQTFYNPGPMFPNITVNGAWIGAAVAWQIQASTGYENPCFYEPLYLNGTPGPAFLNMTQGDQISITMTGFPGSAVGEQLSILDLTNGQSSAISLYNSTGNYPLNPSYVANNYQNGLEWTPGGEYPVVFAFETGHAGNYNWPFNNSFGGCSPGSQSTPADPAAPCPSYDGGSWANDTLAPWFIQPPTFFNAAAVEHPSQVAFTQTFGGISIVSQLSGGACNGLTGSAWCTYPWYSYSCRSGAFSFGATDYAGVTSDFGKYNQYEQDLKANGLLFGFYPPLNFSIPTCKAPSFTVTVGASGGGSAYFLSQPFSTATPVSGLGSGEYSLNAINAPGAMFDHWTVSGGASVATTTSAYTALDVSGAGNVTAVFSATPRTTNVSFQDSHPKGMVDLLPTGTFNGPFSGTGNPIGTFSAGASTALSPGIYGIQAYPPIGYNFSSWSVSGGGATVAAASFPFTWLVVDGSASSVTVTANYVATSSHSVVELFVIGNGTATLGTLTVTNSGGSYSFGLSHPRPGTYHLNATLGNGSTVVNWLYGPSGVMTDFAQDTFIDLEQGLTVVEAVFGTVATVSVNATPAALGAVTLLSPALGPMTGGTESLAPGTYTIAADPAAGADFTGWSTTGGVTAVNSSSLITDVVVMTSGSITGAFSASPSTATVTVGARHGMGGAVQFDGGPANVAPTAMVAGTNGHHWVAPTPKPGWVFVNWTLSGKVTAVGAAIGSAQEVNITGKARIVAVFAPAVFPLTFVAWEPEGSTPSNATLTIAGTTLHTGETVWLATGSYHATIAGPDDNVQHWTATSNITTAYGNPAGVKVSLWGSGTVYALIGDSDHDAGTGAPSPVHGAAAGHGPAAHGSESGSDVARTSGGRTE